jgi:hypothetical protein
MALRVNGLIFFVEASGRGKSDSVPSKEIKTKPLSGLTGFHEDSDVRRELEGFLTPMDSDEESGVYKVHPEETFQPVDDVDLARRKARAVELQDLLADDEDIETPPVAPVEALVSEATPVASDDWRLMKDEEGSSCEGIDSDWGEESSGEESSDDKLLMYSDWPMSLEAELTEPGEKPRINIEWPAAMAPEGDARADSVLDTTEGAVETILDTVR